MPVTRFEDLDLTRQYTVADYVTWRFRERVELLRGWVSRMSPAPNLYHQTIAANLYAIVGTRVERPCRFFPAPFDVYLARTDGGESVVQPDMCVVCDESKLVTRGCEGAPDWVVEILSPGNTKREMRDKYALYEEAGVREYWIIDPEHVSIDRYLLQDGRYRRLEPRFEDDAEAFGPKAVGGVELLGADIFRN